MANEWYVQHGGKQYGPMTSANLKKLAADRKISPSTQVRLGAAGNWVAASCVQGLFAAQPAAAPAPPQAAPPPPQIDLAALDVPPSAPPMASPLARVPFGSVAPVSKQTKAEAPIAARILGAVGLVFGILALATFWLPMLGGPMGWTGIVVGGLGVLLGIGGLVLSAMHNGSGLYLNVAGTSSAAVGLVLTVVLGVTFGMFSRAPEPQPVVVVQRPTLPPAPKVEPPPKEPEPPPEPVWVDAGEAIEQGPIRARIVGVGIELIRLESTDLATLKASKPQPMLKIRVAIDNTTADKIVEVPGWTGMSGPLGAGVDLGALLKQSGSAEASELGKTLDASTATATLTDSADNNYKQTPAVRLFGVTEAEDHALRPADTAEKELVFQPPIPAIEYLRLELPPSGFSGSEPLRFQIPKAMIKGL